MGSPSTPMNKTKLTKQIAHIREHQAEFDVLHGYHRNVQDYFDDYADDYERDNNNPDALYLCICSDLGITPKHR